MDGYCGVCGACSLDRFAVAGDADQCRLEQGAVWGSPGSVMYVLEKCWRFSFSSTSGKGCTFAPAKSYETASWVIGV
jgi:hypothetical protein